MNKRNIDTIIAVMAGRAVWTDRTGNTLQTLALGSHASAALALTALLQTHPAQRGFHALVLSAEFFTQTVRLPAAQTHGLSSDELTAALVFEVEPFSNIPQAHGQAAFVAGSEASGLRVWNVLQIARSEIQCLQTAVGAAGGRVVGLASADLASLSSLTDHELAARLRNIAREAEAPSPPFPVVFPCTKRLNISVQALAACLTLALVCCTCLAHAIRAKAHLAALRRQTRTLATLTDENAQIESANAALRSKIDALEKTRAARESAAQTFARYRTAWRALMHGLLASCDGTLVLRRIDGGAFFEAEISGLSTSERAPGDYLAQLAEHIGPDGWHIQSEALQPVTSLGGLGPVHFSFRVRLDGPADARRPAPNTSPQDW